MKPVIFKTASGIIKWYMEKMGYKGWTSLWNTIYMMPGYEFSTRLRKHELKHIDQMSSDGKILFTIKYTYWWIIKGYKDNPYEVEARNAENS